MQLRKMTLMFAAALGMMLVACDGGGRESLTCSTNADCLESEVCHPNAKVCVQTCTSSADCPNAAKTCDALSAADTTKICKCSTDALCQTDERVDASTLTCSSAYKVCVPPGSTPAACTKDADCSSGQSCNVGTGACEAVVACTGTSKGDACSYGQFCSSSKCTSVPVAPKSCENFSKNYPTWSASSGGPVIYAVERGGFQTNSDYCQSDAPDAFLIRVRAYRTDKDWPTDRSGVAGFFYVTTAGAESDVVNKGLLVPNTGYNRTAGNLKDAEFNIYLCRPSGASTIQVGFYFTGGNPVCQQINK
jgi:hypothetical protein